MKCVSSRKLFSFTLSVAACASLMLISANSAQAQVGGYYSGFGLGNYGGYGQTRGQNYGGYRSNYGGAYGRSSYGGYGPSTYGSYRQSYGGRSSYSGFGVGVYGNGLSSGYAYPSTQGLSYRNGGYLPRTQYYGGTYSPYGNRRYSPYGYGSY